MFIDTHAHLNFDVFKNDYREVIDRAFASDVKGIINIGSNLETSKRAVEIADEQDEGVYAAIGLHPIRVKDEDFDEEGFLKLAKNKKVVAIGETGLDYYDGGITRFSRQAGSYYRDNTTVELQKEIFRKSIQLAQKVGKPIILHSRDAGDDVLSVLMEEKNDHRGVMHCFAGDWQYAKVVFDLGFYISFTGLITFSKNYASIDVIKNAPLEKLLIETDCPYMTPEPYRGLSRLGGRAKAGKRNEPAFIIEVAKKIAEIKKIPLEKVAEQTSKNAIELFGLKV